MLWGRVERVTRQASLGDCGLMSWPVFTAMLHDVTTVASDDQSAADAEQMRSEIAAAKQAAADFRRANL